MVKSKVRVRHLTLPPSWAFSVAGSADQQDEGNDDCQAVLEKEQMARVTDISLLAGNGALPRCHVHGVEPSWGSKL
jgi:hypothetical protein